MEALAKFFKRPTHNSRIGLVRRHTVEATKEKDRSDKRHDDSKYADESERAHEATLNAYEPLCMYRT